MADIHVLHARHAEQCAEAAEEELFISRQNAVAARVRAEAAERKYLDLRDKAAVARREANENVLELAAKRKVQNPLRGCSRTWWQNVCDAVVVVEDYESQQRGVFSLRVGERIYVLYSEVGGQWLYGLLPGSSDPLGWFPSRAVTGLGIKKEADAESSRDGSGGSLEPGRA